MLIEEVSGCEKENLYIMCIWNIGYGCKNYYKRINQSKQYLKCKLENDQIGYILSYKIYVI